MFFTLHLQDSDFIGDIFCALPMSSKDVDRVGRKLVCSSWFRSFEVEGFLVTTSYMETLKGVRVNGVCLSQPF